MRLPPEICVQADSEEQAVELHDLLGKRYPFIDQEVDGLYLYITTNGSKCKYVDVDGFIIVMQDWQKRNKVMAPFTTQLDDETGMPSQEGESDWLIILEGKRHFDTVCPGNIIGDRIIDGVYK